MVRHSRWLAGCALAIAGCGFDASSDPIVPALAQRAAFGDVLMDEATTDSGADAIVAFDAWPSLDTEPVFDTAPALDTVPFLDTVLFLDTELSLDTFPTLDTEPTLDDASSDSQDTGGSDADAAECPPPGVYNPFDGHGFGCPAVPDCDDTDCNGDPCVPVCSEACVVKSFVWQFWVTLYSVDGTRGQGRHQGLAVLGVDLAYDRRFPFADYPALRSDDFVGWPDEASFFGLATDIEHRLAGPARDFARCGGELLVDQGFFNHGRSFDRRPENARHRRVVPNEIRVADVPYAVWSDAASRARGGGTFVARMNTCQTASRDGYCDAICGNCSYALPDNAAIRWVMPRVGDWSDPGDRVSGPGGCVAGQAASYYGGPGQESIQVCDDVPGWELFCHNVSSPFTHCARLGCNVPDANKFERRSVGASVRQQPPTDPLNLMTGRYGHNSNADAEAEYLHFTACGGDPFTGADRAHTLATCRACGVNARAQPGLQHPCDARSNTASTWWGRTSNALGDLLGLQAGNVDGPSANPRCVFGRFTVHGM